MSRREFKDWQHPIRSLLVLTLTDSFKAISSVRTWEHKSYVASLSLCTYTKCSARVVPPVAWMWLSPEDSRRWSVASLKSRSSRNVGHKPRQDKGRWSY